MKRSARLAQWTVVGMAVLALFWVAASVGGWSPDLRRMTTSVHGPQVADYRAESPQILAPLSSEITKDASQDEASAGHSRPKPGTTPSGGPSPSPSGSAPTPSASVLPTLPLPTGTLVTPTLPGPTPPPTPTLPTPPPLP
jgi:hypothetical protein